MTEWPELPDPLPALGADVHVWAVTLDSSSWETDFGLQRLSRDEQARAQRFKFAQDRRRFVVAHAALRDILARYTTQDPRDLQFSVGVNGKPKLAGEPNGGAIEFNLSHSHERALIAVNRLYEIGVDIEYVKGDFEIFEVANRFFTAAEVAALRSLPESLQRRAFYKCWTSKEAFLKAKGTGLSGKLDEVEIATVSGEVRIRASVSGWILTELLVAHGYEAALVTREKPFHVSCFRWQRNETW